MFVQSHFQRARHQQAPSVAGSAHSVSAAANHNHANHSTHHQANHSSAHHHNKRAHTTATTNQIIDRAGTAQKTPKFNRRQTPRRRSRWPLDCERRQQEEKGHNDDQAEKEKEKENEHEHGKDTTTRNRLSISRKEPQERDRDDHVNQQMRSLIATNTDYKRQQTLTAALDTTKRQPVHQTADIRLSSASLSGLKQQQQRRFACNGPTLHLTDRQPVQERAATSGVDSEPGPPVNSIPAATSPGSRSDHHKLISSSCAFVLVEIKQVLHCFLLFLAHFVQHQWQTFKRPLLSVYMNYMKKLWPKQHERDADTRQQENTMMRHNQQMNFGAQNQSFDSASRAMASRHSAHHTQPCSSNVNSASYYQQQSVWLHGQPPEQQPPAFHAHRHNHYQQQGPMHNAPQPAAYFSAAIPQASSYAEDPYEPRCRSQLETERLYPSRPPLQSAASYDLSFGANSGTSSRASSGGLFMNVPRHSLTSAHVDGMPFNQQQEELRPRGEPTASEPAQMRGEHLVWRWHMRHTVDGSPMGFAAHPPRSAVPAGLGTSSCFAACGREMASNLNGIPPDAARDDGLYDMPHRASSISSPTLMESTTTGGYNNWLRHQRQRMLEVQRSPDGHLGQGLLRELRERRLYEKDLQNDVGRGRQGAPVRKEGSERRPFSTKVGSDSELFKQRPPVCSLSGDCSSASSVSSNRANLVRMELDRQTGSYIHHPATFVVGNSSGSLSQPCPAAADTRRRLNRQSAASSSATSGTSAASPYGHELACNLSHYCSHNFAGHQANWPQLSGLVNQTHQHAPTGARVSKSDTDTKPATNEQATENRPTRVLLTSQQRQQRDNSNVNVNAKPQTASVGGVNVTATNGHHSGHSTTGRSGVLTAAGKSKSMVQPHSTTSTATSSARLAGKLSLAGAKRRLGFKQKGGLNSLSVHRSEEVFPLETSELLWARRRRHQTIASSTNNTTNANTQSTATTASSDSLNDSMDELELSSKWFHQFGAPPSSGSRAAQQHIGAAAAAAADPKVCFVEGLGAGQIASRQALVSPYLGDIQVSLSDRRGMLEVEIIRVRQLQLKPGAKRLPSPYVKVYLMKNKKCVAKFKTSQCRQTLDPLYQQQFIFRDDYSDCVLQIIVWADYGKRDRKSLMGIVQIHLNDLDMSDVVLGWYKLFNAPSMVALASGSSVVSSSKSLRQTLSSAKLSELAQLHCDGSEPAGGL